MHPSLFAVLYVYCNRGTFVAHLRGIREIHRGHSGDLRAAIVRYMDVFCSPGNTRPASALSDWKEERSGQGEATDETGWQPLQTRPGTSIAGPEKRHPVSCQKKNKLIVKLL